MNTITDLEALEVLDSRGNPTVEVHLCLNETHWGKALVPSGASTGMHEALELRDKNPDRFMGKGVLTAVQNVNTTIKEAIVGRGFNTIQELDDALIALDGTANKEKLGANSILGVSMARCVATAQVQGIPLFKFLGDHTSLPTPMINVMNGGAHATDGLDVQECMLVPVGAKSFPEAVRMGAEVFHTLKGLLKKQGLTTTVGDEGGFAPPIRKLEEALGLMVEAIETAGYSTDQIKLALDVAASEIFADGIYNFAREGVKRTGEELINYYDQIIEKYPLISIEDGFAEDDIPTRIAGTKQLGDKVMIVGDDLFVTNPQRLQDGIDQRQANAILIKLNQIGTVSETLQTIALAKQHGFATIISHRSGETEDSFIADLSVATDAKRIKTGSMCRTDRTAKYNQLLRIDAYNHQALHTI